MMQLLCNGVRLDMYDNASLQFTKTNPMFSWGEMSAERTVQFKLPATPTNDRVLGLARHPAYKSDGMRKKFSAQLQSGIVVMDGYLYVSSYDGKDYAGIFVGGLAYTLYNFGDYQWGSLVLPYAYASGTVYDADNANIPMVAKVKYKNDSPTNAHDYERYMPSINIEDLFAELTSQNVLQISGMVGQNIRLIRNTQYGLREIAETLINTNPTAGDLGLSVTGNDPIVVANGIIAYDQQTQTYTSAKGFGFSSAYISGGAYITFPDDMDDNLLVCYAIPTSQDYKIAFLGTRTYDGNTYSGEPNKGKTILFNPSVSPEVFFIVDGSALYESGGDMFFGGFAGVPNYSLNVRVTSGNAQGWLPTEHSMLNDLSIGELLKLYASMTGTLVNVKVDGSVEFVSSIPKNDTIELKGISIKSVERTFYNYAQVNYIKFTDSDNVLESEVLSVEYNVPNTNISGKKDLLVLKEIEGGINNDDGYDALYVRGTEENTNGNYEIPNDVPAVAGTYEYMQRVSLAKSNQLQDLCDESTYVKVEARMSMAEFRNMGSTTTCLLNNILYIWTEATWQNDVAEISLAKLV